MAAKLVVAVRTDLDLGKGKLAAQVGHACVDAALAAQVKRPREFGDWMDHGQPKVVVKVGSLKELQDLVGTARGRNLLVHTITDAGRTQVDPGTMTCAAFGPADGGLLDTITGHLKLW